MATIGSTNTVTLTGDIDATLAMTQLILPNGNVVQVETALLLAREDAVSASSPSAFVTADETQVIPLIEENLTVGKRTIETAKVRLVKTVTEYQEALNEPLAVRTYDVDRVILNHPIDTAPAVRQEGATTIYPVVEEQLVLTKQLMLKEEVRITVRNAERVDTQVVTLHREHLTIEREDLTRK